MVLEVITSTITGGFLIDGNGWLPCILRVLCRAC
jgi:hypothetical protein